MFQPQMVFLVKVQTKKDWECLLEFASSFGLKLSSCLVVESTSYVTYFERGAVIWDFSCPCPFSIKECGSCCYILWLIFCDGSVHQSDLQLLSLGFWYGTSQITPSRVYCTICVLPRNPAAVMEHNVPIICLQHNMHAFQFTKIRLRSSPLHAHTLTRSLSRLHDPSSMIPHPPPLSLSKQLHSLSFVPQEEKRGASVLFTYIYLVWHHAACPLTSLALWQETCMNPTSQRRQNENFWQIWERESWRE